MADTRQRIRELRAKLARLRGDKPTKAKARPWRCNPGGTLTERGKERLKVSLGCEGWQDEETAG